MQQFMRSLMLVYPAHSRYLLAALEDVQNQFGFVPELAASELSRFFKIRKSEVRKCLEIPGVFRSHPLRDQVLQVCCGPICSDCGSRKLLTQVQKQLDETSEAISVLASPCMGNCDNPPVVKLNDAKIVRADARALIRKLRGLTGEDAVS
ncbi:MAG: NAD(P)H-dependent oxidoreductase subunit E [Mariprofundaceae bacterium]